MQFQHEPRQQDFETPTGFRIAKANWDKAVQAKIVEAALSDGKVTKGYFTQPRKRRQQKEGYPPHPLRRDFESEESFKEALRHYSATVQKINYWKRKEKSVGKPLGRKRKTGITLVAPRRNDFVSEEAYQLAKANYQREYRRQYNKSYNLKKKGVENTNTFQFINCEANFDEACGQSMPLSQRSAEIEPLPNLYYGAKAPSLSAVEMAKAYLAESMDAAKLQGLIDNFIISLAFKEAMKKIENI